RRSDLADEWRGRHGAGFASPGRACTWAWVSPIPCFRRPRSCSTPASLPIALQRRSLRAPRTLAALRAWSREESAYGHKSTHAGRAVEGKTGGRPAPITADANQYVGQWLAGAGDSQNVLLLHVDGSYRNDGPICEVRSVGVTGLPKSGLEVRYELQ